MTQPVTTSMLLADLSVIFLKAASMRAPIHMDHHDALLWGNALKECAFRVQRMEADLLTQFANQGAMRPVVTPMLRLVTPTGGGAK